MADHVPDHHAQAAVGKRQGVVEVPARAAAGGRQVPDLHPRRPGRRQLRRQQRPLQGLGRPALRLVEARALQRLGALAGHRADHVPVALGEAALVLAEAERDRADRLLAHPERHAHAGRPEPGAGRREPPGPVRPALEPQLLPAAQHGGQRERRVERQLGARREQVIGVPGGDQDAGALAVAHHHRACRRAQGVHGLGGHHARHLLLGDGRSERGGHPLQALGAPPGALGRRPRLLLALVAARVLDGQRRPPGHLERRREVALVVPAAGLLGRHERQRAEYRASSTQRQAHVRGHGQAAQAVRERRVGRVGAPHLLPGVGHELGLAREHHARRAGTLRRGGVPAVELLRERRLPGIGVRDLGEPRAALRPVGEADRHEVGDPRHEQPGEPGQPLVDPGARVEHQRDLGEQPRPLALALGGALEARARQRLAPRLGEHARGVAIGGDEPPLLGERHRDGADHAAGHQRQRRGGAVDAPRGRLVQQLRVPLPPFVPSGDPDRLPGPDRVGHGGGEIERHPPPATELAPGPIPRQGHQLVPGDLVGRGGVGAQQAAHLRQEDGRHVLHAYRGRERGRRLLELAEPARVQARLGEQAGVRQRQPGPGADLLEEPEVDLPEPGVPVGREREDPDGAAARPQRDDGRRARRPRPQGGLQLGVDAGRGEVLVQQLGGHLRDEHGAPGAGDPGHAALVVRRQRAAPAHRAHQPLQVRVAGGARDEPVAPLLVEHLDDAGLPQPVREQPRERRRPLLGAHLRVERRGHLRQKRLPLAVQPPVVDVHADAHEAGALRRRARRRAAIEQPPVRARAVAQAVFHLERHRLGDGPPVDGEAAVAVVGVDAVDPPVPQLLPHRAPGELQPGPVEERAGAVAVGGPHQGRRGVRERPEAPLGPLRETRLRRHPAGLPPPRRSHAVPGRVTVAAAGAAGSGRHAPPVPGPPASTPRAASAGLPPRAPCGRALTQDGLFRLSIRHTFVIRWKGWGGERRLSGRARPVPTIGERAQPDMGRTS